MGFGWAGFVCLVAGAAPPPRDGAVRYDAATHRARGSSGCGSASPYQAGKTTKATGKYAGVTWTYLVYVPKEYDSKTPLPLIVHHHGWGLTAEAEEKGAGITALADKLGFVSVTPQGMNDNSHAGGPWYSWNCVGSTGSPGPAGPTCTSKANYPSYCYSSCPDKKKGSLAAVTAEAAVRGANATAATDGGRAESYTYSYGDSASYTYSYEGADPDCADSPQCWWTTCDETVTPSGTGVTGVGGFLPSLYDTLESQLCIDTTREYASGESNGGMQTYQLGVDLASRARRALDPQTPTADICRVPAPTLLAGC